MIQLTDKVWAVEVPECQDAELHFQPSIEDMLNNRPGMSELIIWYTAKACGSPKTKMTAKLPMTGTWRFLFTTKTATEEDARKVVEREELFINGNSQGILYCNYHCQHDVCEWYKFAADSLNSLLCSKSLDPNKNYALIEKQSTNGTE